MLYASDEPWGDQADELARMQAAAGDGELAELLLNQNFSTLYG